MLARNRAVIGNLTAPLVGAVLALTVLVTYLPALGNGFLNYDDDTYVTENAQVQEGVGVAGIAWALSSSRASNWHPLTWLSHMLDWQLYGNRAFGHHLTSLLLHALNTVLLFLLLHRLTEATWRPAAVATFFGLHPLHVQSVAWISERKDLLCACCFLLSLLAYVRRARADSRPRLQVGAWLLFALALLAKPMAVSLPLVLLLLDAWPLGRWRPGAARGLLLEKLPFAVLAAASSVVTFLVQRAGGGMAGLGQLGIAARVENALVSYLRYLGKTLWPADLAVLYPFEESWPVGLVVASGLLVAGFSVAAVVLRRRRPYLLVGWLWFVGTLVPVIGLVHVGQQAMADRYMYLPMIGLLLLLAWGAADLVAGRRRLARLVAAATVVAAALCGWRVRAELGYWRDSETLFRRELAVARPTSTAEYKLGLALNDQGRLDEAYQHFHASLVLSGEELPALLALGVVCNRRGELAEAQRWLERVLAQDPENAEAHYQMGVALDRQGRLDDAASHYQRALRSDPALVDAHLGLGVVFARQGQLDLGMRQFGLALERDPKSAAALYNLGLGHSQRREWAAAADSFRRSLAIDPRNANAHNNLGLALLAQRQTEAAADEFREALRRDPNHQRARSNLAATTGSETPPAPDDAMR